MEDIRKEFLVSRPVVARWFREHGIEARNFLERHDRPGKDELYRLHIVEKWTLKDLRLHYRTSNTMIKKWLQEYDIPLNMWRKKRKAEKPSKAVLEYKHRIEKKTLVDIGKDYGVTGTLVGMWFKEDGIDVQLYPVLESKAEEEVRSELNRHGYNFQRRRGILSDNKEIDCYDDSLKLAIEYNGLRWHSDAIRKNITRRTHLDKLLECEKRGIQLITIFEDEWLEKREIVLSIIRSKLGISRRLYAKDCSVAMISEQMARKFLDENHIQGSIGSIKYAYALFHENVLVAIMTFGNHRGHKTIVLNRLCFLKDTVVIGGAERLFKMALKDIQEPIISWSDRRWSQGKVYEKLGFTKTRTLRPDYSYCKRQKRFSKQSMKKSAVGCPPDVKEIEFNRARGFAVIWDCGKDVWEYDPNKKGGI